MMSGKRLHAAFHPAIMRPILLSLAFFSSAAAADFRAFLDTHCLECHDADARKGGLDLSSFTDETTVLADREVWRSVYEKVESHQMPPPKQKTQPTQHERAGLLAWIMDIATRPDPALGARDPGKPVLRRLTRLEYNNTIRDLLELDTDVFMFPERLPLAEKSYFQPARGAMGDRVEVRLREYGGKYPVLLPQAGLPADNRAEHGFRNRGDAMNFSPLMLEQYVALAGSIVNRSDLPQRSRVFAELLGVDFNPQAIAGNASSKESKGDAVFPAAGAFAPDVPALKIATGSADNAVSSFRGEVIEAFREGRGGVFNSADAAAGASSVPGKGAVMRVRYGDAGTKALMVNPNEDIWLAAFATAAATSGKKLFTNQTKGAKKFELTFGLDHADADEGVIRLGVCVLGRKGQSGEVSLTAHFSDGTDTSATATLPEGTAGATFVSFAAVPGEIIKSLVVDGSKFSGDHVLLDDLGFITNGKPHPDAAPPPAFAQAKKPAPVPPSPGVKKPASTLPPAERLAKFVERAFRRPATAEEHARFGGLFESARKAGKSEAEAMRGAVQAVLSSPGFLFLSEPVHAGDPKVRPLNDFEIASRLSYFLWASGPDGELLTAAAAGKLHEPATLEAQTLRLLRDPKARELSESFAVQWLRLDQLHTSKPDRELFKPFYSGPQGKDTMHGSALVEALLLFETVMTENRSILDFIDARYTWLNPRLAKLYGITLEDTGIDPGVNQHATRELKKSAKDANNRWRRVTLTDTARGGFLTMVAPLTVTSLPFRTSPVKRGAWLLEAVFNRPPTEPKVAFAVENDTREAAQALSIRQRFEAHRNKAACYSCHIRLDPPGFALERFDAIGAWRESDAGVPVDAKGEWNGTPFDGPAEYKAMLAKAPHEFVRGFIEHLLAYALGRRLEIFDMPAVEAIERAAADDGYKLSRIILEVVKSYPFGNVRNQPAIAH